MWIKNKYSSPLYFFSDTEYELTFDTCHQKLLLLPVSYSLLNHEYIYRFSPMHCLLNKVLGKDFATDEMGVFNGTIIKATASYKVPSLSAPTKFPLRYWTLYFKYISWLRKTQYSDEIFFQRIHCSTCWHSQ